MTPDPPPTSTDPQDTPARTRILVVDDDPIVADSLAEFLQAEGYDAATAMSAPEALEMLEQAAAHSPQSNQKPHPFNCVLTDVAMPGMSGLELLREMRDKHPDIVVVMITAYGTIESAVEAIRHGAVDYLAKPIVDTELRLTLEKALRQQALLAENFYLRSRLDARYGMENIIGSDYRMVKAFELIEAVAPSKATVLMTGESGTGKSLVARAIHERSQRRAAPFVEIHCGSIPETLLESELFGHVKGAFTGAHIDKNGKFFVAEGGTLFIDEINSASPAMQMKLLRVLQERTFEPVGSTETVEADVRVILATNQGLEELVAKGEFRQDLYYRINVVKIELPPLRDRPTDIPALVQRFIEDLSAEHTKTITGITDETLDILRRYPCPGNVRELRNIIERAVVLARRPTISIEDLPANVVEGSAGPLLFSAEARAGMAFTGADVDAPNTPWTPTPLAEALEGPEKRILLKALKANDWNRQKTADQLGINRTTLYKKIKSYGLDRLAG